MNLLDAFEYGAVAGISGHPDKIVETVLSKLFFFGDRVFKVYKWRNGSIGDFTDSAFRKDFFRNDFRWNASMSPETYRRLGSVKWDGYRYVEASELEAEDYFIEMNKIDEDGVFFHLLQKGEILEEDLRVVVKTLFERLDSLTESVSEEFADIFSIPLPDMHVTDMRSTREWIHSHEDSPFKTEAGAIADSLLEFIPTHAPFRSFDTDRYLASVDNHAGNILLGNGRATFIDSMPPMRIWRARSPLYILSRTATDVEVLAGKKFSDPMYEEYSRIRGELVDPVEKSYCQSVSALIMALYQYGLKEFEIAKRYLDFSREKMLELGDAV